MRHSFFVRTAMVMAVTAAPLCAQVPQLLHYQGRVRVSGADYSGTGQFKFALVNGAGSTTFWSNDGTSTAGSQPSAAVSLQVQGGLYNLLLGDATVPNMTVLTPGVFSNNDVRLRVWFSDGANGWQQLTPDQRVAAVGYALMAEDVKDGAVTSAKIAAGAVTSAKLAPGAVNAAALAPNVISDSLAADGQGTVPSGGALVSLLPNAPALLAGGYIPVGSLNSSDIWSSIAGGTARDRAAAVWTGTLMLIWGDGPNGLSYNPTTNVWGTMTNVNQPANRENPLAVWTGTEMIVWGGRVGTAVGGGGRYNPSTDTWTTIAQTNAPGVRYNASAVWTGSEMIIWGGTTNGTAVYTDGARYNPNIGTGGQWTTIPANADNVPPGRQLHTAIWTGAEMIIHGGMNTALGTYGDTRLYNPVTSTWAIGAVAPAARFSHNAVWTGSALLVWGGALLNQAAPISSGFIYTRATNSWSTMSTTGQPAPRFQHAGVWTGAEMIVWGGSTATNMFIYDGTGGRYNPFNNSWTLLTNAGAPVARVNPNLVWTGSEMIVWGGSNGAPLDVGGRYRAGQTYYIYQRP